MRLIVVAVGVLFMRLPTAFLPDEDQGILFSPGRSCRRAPRRSARWSALKAM